MAISSFFNDYLRVSPILPHWGIRADSNCAGKAEEGLFHRCGGEVIVSVAAG
jgi:hypothetical protein